MKSPLPKVLHPVAGRPMIHKVIQTVKSAGAEEVRVVVGYSENLVRQVVEPLGVTCHKQQKQRGTADAVKSAKVENLDGLVLILNGDHPLILPADIQRIIKEFKEEKADLSVVTSVVKRPGSLGRIIRHMGDLKAIVETADASAETLKIREVNTGIYIAKAQVLRDLLPKVRNHNAQKEFYLTDIITLGLESGLRVAAIQAPPHVAFGVNTQQELAKATKVVFRRKAQSLMEEGVVLINPAATYIEEDVEVGAASVIYPGVYLKGHTRIGKYCVLEPNVYAHNTQMDDGVQVRAGSYLESAEIKKGAVLGPYARLRPETVIGEEAQIGNFVEMKKTVFGARAKAAHLSYIGDAEVGEGTNIGCGTITCNYAADKKKYKTKIGSQVFVGSDTQFVAPVEIGDRAIIGSGSTITKSVPADALAVARGKQVIKEGYAKKFQSASPAPAEKPSKKMEPAPEGE